MSLKGCWQHYKGSYYRPLFIAHIREQFQPIYHDYNIIARLSENPSVYVMICLDTTTGEIVAVLCEPDTTKTYVENMEVVVYTSLVERATWVRPHSMWHEYVWKDGVRVPRFKLVT